MNCPKCNKRMKKYLYGNEPENYHIFSVANEWLQNLITNILNLFKGKILII